MNHPSTRAACLLAVLAGLCAAQPGQATAQTPVELRVEGATWTLFEGPVETTPHPIDGGDGTGPHACDGPPGGAPRATPLGALDDGLRGGPVGFAAHWDPSFLDFFVDRIGPDASDPATASYWYIRVNGAAVAGGCNATLDSGDEALFYYAPPGRARLLRLQGPRRALPGVPFEVFVTVDGAPAAGASVGGRATNAGGVAVLTIAGPGTAQLKAERSDAIRSNGLAVCVGDDAQCSGIPLAPVLPRSAIAKLSGGERFARGAGPRVLRGSARGGDRVRVSLLRRLGAGRCRPMLPRARRPRRCSRPRWARARFESNAWRRKSKRLPPGRYLLRSRVAGPHGVEARAKGRNTIGFRVLRRPARAGRLAAAARRYLRRARRRGGGLGAARRVSPTLGITGWAALGLGLHGDASARRNVRYLRRGVRRSRSEADLVRTAAALSAIGGRGATRALRRLRPRLLARQRPDGSYSADVNATALAIASLRALRLGGRAKRAIAWLASRQLPSGGFAYAAGAPPDVDTTGLATLILAPTSFGRRACREAAPFIRTGQGPDGGLAASPGSGSNSQSTGLALGALRACGFRKRGPRTEDRITPIDYLTTVARRRGGIAYSADLDPTPVWSTSQALLGLASRPSLRRFARGVSPRRP